MTILPRPLITLAPLCWTLTSFVGPTATISFPVIAPAPSSSTRLPASTVITVACSISTSATTSSHPSSWFAPSSDELGVRKILVVACGRIEDFRHVGRPVDVHLQVGEYRQHRNIAPDDFLDAVIHLLAA